MSALILIVAIFFIVAVGAVMAVFYSKKSKLDQAQSNEIRDLINDAEFPKDVGDEILKEFSKLKSKYVAVRSSATAEDSSIASWAGELESYLNTTKANLLENVKNLKSHDKGKTFKIISDALADLDYYVKVKVLNSMEYGNVPQNRERVYIVGFKSKTACDAFDFPEEISLSKTIANILEDSIEDKYYYTNSSPLYKQLKEVIKSPDIVYQWRRAYVRENKSGVCPTLTANMGMGGHNVPLVKDKKGIRSLRRENALVCRVFPKLINFQKICLTPNCISSLGILSLYL